MRSAKSDFDQSGGGKRWLRCDSGCISRIEPIGFHDRLDVAGEPESRMNSRFLVQLSRKMELPLSELGKNVKRTGPKEKTKSSIWMALDQRGEYWFSKFLNWNHSE